MHPRAQALASVHPFLSKALLAALLPALAAIGCSSGPRAPERRDVLLVTVDSLRADRPSFMGGSLDTPSMDSLAADAVVFTQAISPVPQTLPSLVSLHTGLYPPAHGVRDDGPTRLADSKPTLAGLFKEAGYRTGAFAAALDLHPKFGLDRGFDDYREAFAEIPRPRTSPAQGIPAPRITDKAIEWLQGVKEGESFFLWVNYFDPHYFYEPPEPFKERYAESPYDGEVALVDREMGRLLAWMRDHGRDKSTIIVLAGNHGEGLGDGGEKYHGILLREATLHVPLVVRPAGGMKERSTQEAPVSLVDVAPTLLDLAGIGEPEGMQGESLAGFATGQATPSPGRILYFETTLPRTLFGWASMRGTRSGDLKYVEAPGVKAAHLYDLGRHDEEDDVGDAHPADLAKLAEAARQMGGAAGGPDPLPAPLVDSVIALGLSTETPPAPSIVPATMIETGNAALQAHRSFQRRMMQAASFLLEDVLKEDPENYLALVDSASIRLGSQQLEDAADLLRRAQEVYPADGEIYHLMGHAMIYNAVQTGQVENLESARLLFETAVRLAPLNEEALYDLACATATRDSELALNYLERAVASGFRDYRHMSVDRDLDPIRSTARFRQITGGNVPDRPAAPAGAGAPPASP